MVRPIIYHTGALLTSLQEEVVLLDVRALTSASEDGENFARLITRILV